MRILTTLTYYSPHVSGLTVYARRLIRELADRGHDITVLTSHYDRSLAKRELIDGATVMRSPVMLRMSKGALMPIFPLQAAQLMREHDLVHVHLPQFEASAVVLAARLARKPAVVTYHCDIELPRGLARRAFTPAIRLSHYLTGKLASSIVVNSAEYAEATRLPRRFAQKVVAVYPPVALHAADHDAHERLVRRFDASRQPVVGFVGRFAEEKGIEVLIDAVPLVRRAYPDAQFVLVGITEQVPGETVYARLRPRMEALAGALTHIGLLTDGELRAFYETIDVLVLPSTNTTESFGMTQAEAMLAGTPVVSSDLPGVREAIAITGMGRSVAPRDPVALASGIVEVLRDQPRYCAGRPLAARAFGTEQTARSYEELFLRMTSGPRRVNGGTMMKAQRSAEGPQCSGTDARPS